MPRRDDIHTILILGSGPIRIGQAAEFDYSGTQACKALRGADYRVVLVNSNPATIMTDPDVADRTYVEPLTPRFVEKVIAIERPDALLPTLGGQTALNLAITLHETGVLERHGVQLIGASYDAIQKGEDRQRFQQAMEHIGIRTASGSMVASLEEALGFVDTIGYPAIIRPSFTLGGTGSGVARDEAEFRTVVRQGLQNSPVHTVLVEESILGWKEYELEVMRDHNDTVVIICSIENVDAMGVHTGDSITVAPAQTLSDKEYQQLRDYAIAIIREVGVDTGGSNIQFAVDPANGEVVVIEMNPRVSRSSALASKATGYPIAKIAALLAVGYHLDELPNDITKETKAAFEPSIDYVVTKLPRFAFEKFPGTPVDLGTQMRSVGEVMAIGRTFKESLLKALRSLELDVRSETGNLNLAHLEQLLTPNPLRAAGTARAAAPRQGRRLPPQTHRHRPLVSGTARRDRGGPKRRFASSPSPKIGGRCCGGRSNASVSAMATWPACAVSRQAICAPCGWPRVGRPCTRRSTPAPPSSRPTPPTTTAPTNSKTKWPSPNARRW